MTVRVSIIYKSLAQVHIVVHIASYMFSLFAPFTHMALCTVVITVGHDLKPLRIKGRSIEASNRKSDYDVVAGW